MVSFCCESVRSASAIFLFASVVGLAPVRAKAEPAEQERALEVVTLEEALETARVRAEQFELTQEQLEQALLVRKRAWAALLPVLALNGTFTRADKEIAFNSRVIQKQDSFAGSASVSLSFIRAPAVAGVAEAVHLGRSAEYAAVWDTAGLSFEIARAYGAALAAGRLVEVAKSALKTAKEHLGAVQARRGAGEALGVDETRARMELVSAEGELIRALNAEADTIDLLALLIGREPPLRVKPPRAVDEVSAEASLPAESSRRVDVLAADERVEAAEAGLTSAWLEYLPSVDVVGTYRATENTGFSREPTSWNIVVVAEWLLYDGGLRSANRQQRASELRAAGLQRALLERQAEQEVRVAQRALNTAFATLATATEQRELAAATREMVLRRYRAGLANSLELVEADDDLRAAQVQRAVQELEVWLARLDLLRSIGRGPLGEELARP